MPLLSLFEMRTAEYSIQPIGNGSDANKVAKLGVYEQPYPTRRRVSVAAIDATKPIDIVGQNFRQERAP